MRGVTDPLHSSMPEQLKVTTQAHRLPPTKCPIKITDRFEDGGIMKFEAKKILRSPAAALLLGGAIAMTAPAISIAGAPPATAVVQASDLNLATANGQRTLKRRTESAIDKVCPLRGSVVGSNSGAAHRECAQSVRNSVKQQLIERGGRSVAGT
jgi:UrcA family protein